MIDGLNTAIEAVRKARQPFARLQDDITRITTKDVKDAIDALTQAINRLERLDAARLPGCTCRHDNDSEDRHWYIDQYSEDCRHHGEYVRALAKYGKDTAERVQRIEAPHRVALVAAAMTAASPDATPEGIVAFADAVLVKLRETPLPPP